MPSCITSKHKYPVRKLENRKKEAKNRSDDQQESMLTFERAMPNNNKKFLQLHTMATDN
jgi:hypothetical protein